MPHGLHFDAFRDEPRVTGLERLDETLSNRLARLLDPAVGKRRDRERRGDPEDREEHEVARPVAGARPQGAPPGQAVGQVQYREVREVSAETDFPGEGEEWVDQSPIRV